MCHNKTEYKHVNIHRGTGSNWYWNTNINQWQIRYIQIKQWLLWNVFLKRDFPNAGHPKEMPYFLFPLGQTQLRPSSPTQE